MERRKPSRLLRLKPLPKLNSLQQKKLRTQLSNPKTERQAYTKEILVAIYIKKNCIYFNKHKNLKFKYA